MNFRKIKTSAAEEFGVAFAEGYTLSSMAPTQHLSFSMLAAEKEVQSEVFGHKAATLGGYYAGVVLKYATLPLQSLIKRFVAPGVAARTRRRKLYYDMHMVDGYMTASDYEIEKTEGEKRSTLLNKHTFPEMSARAFGLASLCAIGFFASKEAVNHFTDSKNIITVFAPVQNDTMQDENIFNSGVITATQQGPAPQ